jgi:hypothetical protein
MINWTLLTDRIQQKCPLNAKHRDLQNEMLISIIEPCDAESRSGIFFKAQRFHGSINGGTSACFS